MIILRSFSRVEQVSKVSNVIYELPKLVSSFQGSNYYDKVCLRKMGDMKDVVNAMDQSKKRRAVTTVWMPLSAHLSSSEGGLVNDAKFYSGGPVETVVPVKSVVPVETLVPVETVDQNLESSARETVDSNIYISVSESQHSNQGTKSYNKGSNLCSNYLEDDLDIVGSVQSITEASKQSVPVEVDTPLIRFIKGKGGNTQKQIEMETGVKIKFPLSKEETSIVIEGVSVENVTRASEKIKTILGEAVKSPSLDYSHFISLPLAVHPGLVEKLQSFQNSIMGNLNNNQGKQGCDSNEGTSDEEDYDGPVGGDSCVAVKLKVHNNDEPVKMKIEVTDASVDPRVPQSSFLSDLGIYKSIFIKPKTFHLTVLMLKLWNKERVATAAEILQKVSPKVIEALEGRPISIKLKGLECMKGSPSKARVLYTPVEEIGGEGRLMRACQAIIDAYVEAGLVLEKDACQKLKLHATVMNARHRKRKRITKKFDSFDACNIFKRYGSEEWGEFVIGEAHLSQRFKFDESGYYHCCASIPFPQSLED
ncbi:hypothetical protein AMTRI_Chr05g66930 [Amborella trichopoda]